MTATGHAIIGTVLAAQISNPFLGIPIAILSHFAADAYPHWDTGTNMKKKSFHALWIHSLIDLGLSFIIPVLLIQYVAPQTNLSYVYIMVISAQLFDWLTAPYVFLKWKFFPFDIPYKMQLPFDNRMDKPWGIVWQVAALLVLIAWAKIY